MSNWIEPNKPNCTLVELGHFDASANGGALGGELWKGSDGKFYRTTTYIGDDYVWRAWGYVSAHDAEKYLRAI